MSIRHDYARSSGQTIRQRKALAAWRRVPSEREQLRSELLTILIAIGFLVFLGLWVAVGGDPYVSR